MTSLGQRALISFVVPDLASPILGATTMLAGLVKDRYDVEIVGPDLGHGICPMYRDTFPYKVIPAPRIYRVPEFFRDRAAIQRAVSGDIVVAMKAYANTVPVALAAKKRGAKAAVFMDEWDGAVLQELSAGQLIGRWVRNVHHPLEDIYFPMVERMIPRADLVLSSSRFLQRKFGGALLYPGVDTDAFAPVPSESVQTLRRELGLESVRTILFGGVVRPHKGVEQVLEALRIMGRKDCRLVIVGPDNEHVADLRRDPAVREFVVTLGAQRKEDMPRYLALADVLVIPLADGLLAQSQTPCKVFEAMAMEKPIVASAVSDLPEILDGCGWTAPAGDAAKMAERIAFVLDNPDEARDAGVAARAKCVRSYSRTAMSQRMLDLMGGLLKR